MAVAAALPGTLTMGVALPAQELGDLGLDGGLHQQAHTEAGHLLEDLAEVTIRSEQVAMSVQMRSMGDTRVDTGVGSFLCLRGFERNLRPSSIYTADRTPPHQRGERCGPSG